MIKEKDLRELRPRVRYEDRDNGITLQYLQVLLEQYFQKAGIPIAFRDDVIKFGGLLGGSTQECLVIYHPEHEKDYFNIAVHMKRQGVYVFVTVNDFGESRLFGNQGSSEFLKETLANGDGAEKVGALIGAGIRRLLKGGVDKRKLEDEQDWYLFLRDAFDDIVAYED